jgi:DNA-binding response OmpR family regulator
MEPAARILVIDDEASIRFFLSELLTEDGYEAAAVEHAEAALPLLAEQSFDLALVDLNLPGISGMELIKVMHARYPDVTIIVLTAYASLETAVEALRQGAHDYLFKPSKALELRASVQNGLLKRREKIQQQALITRMARMTQRVWPPLDLPPTLPRAVDKPDETSVRFIKRGQLMIDLLRHAITLDGHILELSPTEFALLAYLADEYPKVVSAKTLVRAVQGYEVSSLEASEILRYHIHRIRLKVRQATGRPDYIRTVRGVGYTLTEV